MENILNKFLDKIEKVNIQTHAKGEMFVALCDKLHIQADKHNVHLLSNELGSYVYNGTHLQLIETGELKQWLLQVALKMGVPDEIAKQYKLLENLVNQFEVSFYKPISTKTKNCINLKNGVFDVITGKLTPHCPEYGFTYTLKFDYNPTASAPMFQKYLTEVLPDADARKVVQEYLAYIFTDLKLEKAMLLYGSGANGKSVLLDIVSALLGKENISAYPLVNLCQQDGRYIRNIADKILNICSDISNLIGDSGIFKVLISGEPVSAREVYKSPVMVTNYAKLLFSCNELPVTSDFSNGYFRRLILVPFEVEIPKEKQNKRLAEQIINSELSGILNYILIGGARLLQSEAFTESATINKQLEEYKISSDNVASFVIDEGLIKSNDYQPQLKDIYLEYRGYCSLNGRAQVSKQKFTERLRRSGFNVFVGAGNKTFINAYKNIKTAC